MKTHTLPKLISLLAAVPIIGFAADTTWTGATSTNWGTSSNWTANAPGFNGTAVFSGTPTSNMPDILGTSKTGVGLDFQSAGWTINDSVGGGLLRIDGGVTNISSAGAGVNTINTKVTSSGSATLTMTIGSGNTLVSSGDWANGVSKTFTGGGTFVLNGANTATVLQAVSFTAANTILANSLFGVNSSTVNNGAKIGGTGIVSVMNYGTLTFGNTAKLAAGGNGTFGSEIGTLTFRSGINSGTGISTNRASVTLDAGSIAEMQIGSGGVGNNDKVVLSLNAGAGGRLNILSGATLNILGSVIQDGTYTLFESTDATSTIVGTFSNVLFNGSAINPANFTLNYSATAITLDVTGLASMIPEPSSVSLIAGAAVFAFMSARRRRA
ncbi:PEP-CTERM sorting domain-containing protein [Rariglobus hedericola]|uniref:PEP-CTERM sorting domain-containing protein n=1 Tax=Rariglobus hedericola TaxID=2597822 RepID=A0A556QP66_9BACT|nr:PEP-CTERM sorting domain-containing protein [Rariglobus hedericola]TSJ78419.1 PEP-CTERM sorting domain-containing protein [Rariglobus hedericola]